ncbi:helix-turn-helix domain-containing protein [Desulfurispora thermophila]|uniref:helix-turn-helix domain-containing protein n=1 Tax=Desulfurispora thermophila TaxID=265470 RepID=UPI00035EFE0A|nr:helix-turn-helix transcriptional regulator [Desulfurispora thermophila]
MPFTYNPLWKKLIDEGMTKEQLRLALDLSPSTIAKMGRGGYVSLEVIERICRYFNCQPNDIIMYIPAAREENQNAAQV